MAAELINVTNNIYTVSKFTLECFWGPTEISFHIDADAGSSITINN